MSCFQPHRFLSGLAVLILVGTCLPALSSPRDDLASPDQATRDAAAKILRQTYVPPARTTWEPLLKQLTPGMSVVVMQKLLKPYHPKSEGSFSGGGGTTTNYRLDDRWILECGTADHENTLIGANLSENMRHIWVPPARNFNGIWVTYYANGQKFREDNYKDGMKLGEFITLHSNDTMWVIRPYDLHSCTGDDTGYFPSGKIMDTAHYKNGKPVGIWTWYREDGSVASTKDHTK